MIHLNFNSLCFTLDIVGILSAIIIGIILVCLILLYRKYEELRPIFKTVLCVGILFTGLYSIYYNITYMTSTGQNIGQILNSVFNKSEIEDRYNSDVNKWTFKTLSFDSTGNTNEYQTKISLNSSSLIDLKSKDYDIYINDNYCFDTSNTSEYVKSSFVYEFYDSNDLILRDILKIDFYSYLKSNLLVLTTNGGTDAVKLWYKYQDKQGITIELREKIDIDLKSDLPFVDKEGLKQDFYNQYGGTYSIYSCDSDYVENDKVIIDITNDCYIQNNLEYLNVTDTCYPARNGLYKIEYVNHEFLLAKDNFIIVFGKYDKFIGLRTYHFQSDGNKYLDRIYYNYSKCNNEEILTQYLPQVMYIEENGQQFTFLIDEEDNSILNLYSSYGQENYVYSISYIEYLNGKFEIVLEPKSSEIDNGYKYRVCLFYQNNELIEIIFDEVNLKESYLGKIYEYDLSNLDNFIAPVDLLEDEQDLIPYIGTFGKASIEFFSITKNENCYENEKLMKLYLTPSLLTSLQILNGYWDIVRENDVIYLTKECDSVLYKIENIYNEATQLNTINIINLDTNEIEFTSLTKFYTNALDYIGTWTNSANSPIITFSIDRSCYLNGSLYRLKTNSNYYYVKYVGFSKPILIDIVNEKVFYFESNKLRYDLDVSSGIIYTLTKV